MYVQLAVLHKNCMPIPHALQPLTFGRVWSEYRYVISTIFLIDFFIVKVFRYHVVIFSDVFQKILARPFMLANQSIVLNTYMNL